MRRCLCCLLLLLGLVSPTALALDEESAAQATQAQSEAFGFDDLERIGEAYTGQEDIAGGVDVPGAFRHVGQTAKDNLGQVVRTAVRSCVLLLAVTLLWGLAQGMQAGAGESGGLEAITLAAVLAITAVAVGDVHSLLSLGEEAIYNMETLGDVLLPGRVGFENQGSVKLNPSYAPLFILKRFAAEDPAWESVWAGSLRMLLRSAPDGFSPDWVTFDREGRIVDRADEDSAVGSYNAIRTYLWAAMTAEDAPTFASLAERFTPMVKAARRLGRPPEKVNLNTLAMNHAGNAGFAGCVLELARRTPGETATADRLRTAVASHDVTRESYYTNVLALFARALDEKRFRIDAEGRLHLPQETR